jgi:hypothetical protein
MTRFFCGLPVRAKYVVLLLCLSTACVACSSTTSLNGTTSGTGTAATATQTVKAPPASLNDYCGVVSPAEIQASINKSITFAFRPFGSTKGDVATVACGFGISETSAPVIEIEFSQTIRGSTVDQFNAFKTQFVSTTPIPNLGDEAYAAVAPTDKDPAMNIQFAVVVRKGSFFFFVGQFNDTNEATVVSADTKVARLYLDRL